MWYDRIKRATERESRRITTSELLTAYSKEVLAAGITAGAFHHDLTVVNAFHDDPATVVVDRMQSDTFGDCIHIQRRKWACRGCRWLDKCRD
jgi:hypothetical protein